MPQVRADWLEEKVTGELLGVIGHVTIRRRVWSAASKHGERTAELRRSLNEARGEYDSGGYSYPCGEEEYRERVQHLAGQLHELSAVPVPVLGREQDRRRGLSPAVHPRFSAAPTAARRRCHVDR
jgi:hypothetical protein